jgi:hypothetical protein
MSHETTFSGQIQVTPTVSQSDHKAFKLVLAKSTFSKNPEHQKDRPLQMSPDGARLSIEKAIVDAGNITHWLNQLIVAFFSPRGYSLDGSIRWTGPKPEDRGTVYAKDNRLEEVQDFIENPGPSWSPVPFASAHMMTLIRALILSADATGCSNEVTTVSSDALRPFQYLLRCEEVLSMPSRVTPPSDTDDWIRVA